MITTDKSSAILLLLGSIIVLLVGILFLILRIERADEGPLVAPGATACTLEAKICPDGSAVGRSGPDCAFAACPGE